MTLEETQKITEELGMCWQDSISGEYHISYRYINYGKIIKKSWLNYIAFCIHSHHWKVQDENINDIDIEKFKKSLLWFKQRVDIMYISRAKDKIEQDFE